MKKILVALLALCGIVGARAEDRPAIMLSVSAADVNISERVVMNEFLRAFTRNGQYRVIDRSRDFARQAERERIRQMDGSVSDEEIRRIGYEAGAEYIGLIIVSGTMGAGYSVSARLVHVETAKIYLLAGETNIAMLDCIDEAADEVVRQIHGGEPRQVGRSCAQKLEREQAARAREERAREDRMRRDEARADRERARLAARAARAERSGSGRESVRLFDTGLPIRFGGNMALGLFSSDSEYELVLESYDDFAYLYGVTAQIPIIGKRFQWNAGDAYAAISLNPEFNISPRKFMAEGYDTISYPIEISEFAISVPVLFRAEFVGIVNWGDIVLWGVYVDAGLQMDFPLNPEWRRYGRYDDPKKPFEGRAGMDLGIPFGIGVSAGGLRYRLNAGIRMISYFTKYSKESGAWFGMGPQLQLWF